MELGNLPSQRRLLCCRDDTDLLSLHLPDNTVLLISAHFTRYCVTWFGRTWQLMGGGGVREWGGIVGSGGNCVWPLCSFKASCRRSFLVKQRPEQQCVIVELLSIKTVSHNKTAQTLVPVRG